MKVLSTIIISSVLACAQLYLTNAEVETTNMINTNELQNLFDKKVLLGENLPEDESC